MADFQTKGIVITPGAGTRIRQGFEWVLADFTNLVGQMRYDTVDPGSPGSGDVWQRAPGGAGQPIRAYVQHPDKGKTELLWEYILQQALNCADQELQALRPHNRTTAQLATPDPARAGRLEFDSSRGMLAYVTDTQAYYLARVAQDGTTYLLVPGRLHTAGLGANKAAPSDVTVNGGFLLAAGTDQVNVEMDGPVPSAWGLVDAAKKNVVLDVLCRLNQAENANDTIDLGGAWEANHPGQTPGSNSTTFAAASVNIGTNNAQYARHTIPLDLQWDAPATDLATGDDITATIKHDPAAGANPVSGIIVYKAYFGIPTYTLGF